MNEPQWNQEAETFARVWQRVSPDLDASPIQPAPLPALPPGDQRTEVLRELITAETIQWRRCRALAQQTGQRALTRLAEKKLRRAKQLAAVLFLRCQVWYLPLSDRRPANHRPPNSKYPARAIPPCSTGRKPYRYAMKVPPVRHSRRSWLCSARRWRS